MGMFLEPKRSISPHWPIHTYRLVMWVSNIQYVEAYCDVIRNPGSGRETAKGGLVGWIEKTTASKIEKVSQAIVDARRTRMSYEFAYVYIHFHLYVMCVVGVCRVCQR